MTAAGTPGLVEDIRRGSLDSFRGLKSFIGRGGNNLSRSKSRRRMQRAEDRAGYAAAKAAGYPTVEVVSMDTALAYEAKQLAVYVSRARQRLMRLEKLGTSLREPIKERNRAARLLEVQYAQEVLR